MDFEYCTVDTEEISTQNERDFRNCKTRDCYEARNFAGFSVENTEGKHVSLHRWCRCKSIMGIQCSRALHLLSLLKFNGNWSGNFAWYPKAIVLHYISGVCAGIWKQPKKRPTSGALRSQILLFHVEELQPWHYNQKYPYYLLIYNNAWIIEKYMKLHANLCIQKASVPWILIICRLITSRRPFKTIKHRIKQLLFIRLWGSVSTRTKEEFR